MGAIARSLTSLCATVLLAVVVPPAGATTVYSNEANFVADNGNAKASLPASVAGDFTAAPFTFIGIAGTLVIDTPQYGQPIPGEDNLLLSGTESFDLASSIPLLAFGFTAYQPSNSSPANGTTGVACYFPCDTGSFTVSFSANGGSTFFDSMTLTPGYDARTFFGYAGTTPFNFVRIVDNNNTIDDEYFAHFRYAPVPEPEIAWLLLAGLGVVAWTRRRNIRG